jgi:hypothetical protein
MSRATAERPLTGRALAAARIRRGRRAVDAARLVSVSGGRITTIEQRVEVPTAFVERSLKAIGAR